MQIYPQQTRIDPQVAAQASFDTANLVAKEAAKELRSHQELIRYEFLANKRFDILARSMGYEAPIHHQEIWKLQKAYRKVMMLAPRGSGKSTAGTVIYSIGRILLNPNIRILIVSNTGGQAEGFLTEIRLNFEFNAGLRSIFGNFVPTHRGAKWGATEIAVSTRTSTTKEMTVTAFGIFGQIITKHYDIIILDDVIDEENIRSEPLREKVRNVIYKSLMPCLEPWGQLICLGTRWHHDDQYGHFLTKADGKVDYYKDYGVWETKRIETKSSPLIRPPVNDTEYEKLLKGLKSLTEDDEDELDDDDLVI